MERVNGENRQLSSQTTSAHNYTSLKRLVLPSLPFDLLISLVASVGSDLNCSSCSFFFFEFLWSYQSFSFSSYLLATCYLKTAAILFEEYSTFGRCEAATLVLVHICCGFCRWRCLTVVGPQSIRTKISVAAAGSKNAVFFEEYSSSQRPCSFSFLERGGIGPPVSLISRL